MKVSGSSAKGAPKSIIKNQAINFSDIGAKLDVSEAMGLCDVLIINSMPLDRSSPYNIRFIQLLDKLTLWSYVASEHKNDFFQSNFKLVSSQLLFYLKELKKGEMIIGKSLNEFLQIIKVLDRFSPNSDAKDLKTEMSTELKELLQPIFKFLSEQKIVTKKFLTEVIKPNLLAGNFRLNIASKGEIEDYKEICNYKIANLIDNIFTHTNQYKENLTALYTSTTSIYFIITSSIIKLYKEIADVENATNFIENSLEICKTYSTQLAETSLNEQKIIINAQKIILTKELILYKSKANQDIDYNLYIASIKESLSSILELKTSLKSTTDESLLPSFMYAISRAYETLVLLYDKYDNTIDLKNVSHCSSLLDSRLAELENKVPLAYSNYLIYLNLSIIIKSKVDAETYVDKSIAYIKNEVLRNEIKSFILEARACNDEFLGNRLNNEHSLALFEKYKYLMNFIKINFPNESHIPGIIKTLFANIAANTFYLLEDNESFRDLIENPDYYLTYKQKLKLLLKTNNMEAKLLINNLINNSCDQLIISRDFFNKESVVKDKKTLAQESCYSTIIYFQLFKHYQDPFFLQESVNYAKNANKLFKKIIHKKDSDKKEFELFVCKLNLSLSYELLPSGNDYKVFLDFLKYVADKKTTELREATTEEEKRNCEEFLKKSKIIENIEIAENWIKANREEKSQLEQLEKAKLAAITDELSAKQDAAALGASEEKEQITSESEHSANLANAEKDLCQSFNESTVKAKPSTLDVLMKLQNTAYKNLKAFSKSLNQQEKSNQESLEFTWSYKDVTYNSKDLSIIQLQDDLYATTNYSSERYKIQIDNCREALSEKGMALRFSGADGVKYLSNNHYEIKVSANGDVRLVAKVILQNEEGKNLLVFNEIMNHKQVTKWTHERVKIIYSNDQDASKESSDDESEWSTDASDGGLDYSGSASELEAIFFSALEDAALKEDMSCGGAASDI